MIDGSHVVVFSQDPQADRVFFADVLGFPHIDAGGGWLIFALPPAEAAMHPTEGTPSHELFFTCNDIESTIEQLQHKGVEFTGGIAEQRWGRIIRMRLPGGGEVGMYEPRHPRPTDH